MIYVISLSISLGMGLIHVVYNLDGNDSHFLLINLIRDGIDSRCVQSGWKWFNYLVINLIRDWIDSRCVQSGWKWFNFLLINLIRDGIDSRCVQSEWK
jgi:hypothetical protein